MFTTMRSKFFLVVAVAMTTSLRAQDTPTDNNVQYNWAFVARTDETGNRRFGVVTQDTSLNTGDEFKLFVSLTKPCFVYVIHRSPSNELSLLFPYDTAMFQKDYKLDKNYYIPRGREWFSLDNNTGTETFYLLASSERLTELENGLRAYFTASSEKRPDAAAFVINEIKDIKKKFRTFSTTAERPISIAGNVRGEKPAVDPERLDVAWFASEISANNFFSKTISIDHK